MARQVDVINGNGQGRGFDMIAGAHEVQLTGAVSLADGCSPVALADTGAAASRPSGVKGSPGAVLGTGMNTDRYTPGIEAV